MVYRVARSNVIAAGLLLALSAAVFVISVDFPGGRGGGPGAAFFPRLVTGAIAVLALVLLVNHVTADDRHVHEIDPAIVRRLVVVTAFPILYVFVMPVVGFPLATVVFLSAFMWYSGARSVPTVIGSSIGITIVLYYIFVTFFRVPLPEGVIPLERVLPSLLHIGVI